MDLPKYYMVGLRPVKEVTTKDGGRAFFAWNWTTGGLESTTELFDRATKSGNVEVIEVSEEEFYARIAELKEELRRQDLALDTLIVPYKRNSTYNLPNFSIIDSIYGWKTRNWKWLSWLPALLIFVCFGVCALAGQLELLLAILTLVFALCTALSVILLLIVLVKFRPRRGVHYAYWNRYLLVCGALVFGLIGFPFLLGYLTIRFKLPDQFFEIPFAVWLVGFPLAWVLWFKFYFLPTWGFWRLRWRYPEMIAAARGFKRRSPAYAWFMPLLFVQGKPYLLVGYGGYMPPFARIATLDAEGKFVTGEALAETLMRCYKLALDVLFVTDSYLGRAQTISNLCKMQRQLQRDFPHFLQNEAYFLEAGGQVYDHWKNIADFKQNLDMILSTKIARMTWQAQWAYDHGLNRLTEISDEQLREVQTQLAKFDAVLAKCTMRIEMIADSAAALQASLQILADPLMSMDGTHIHLHHRRALRRLLKRLPEFCQTAVPWQKPADDFAPQDSDWDSWRRGRELAFKTDNRYWIGFSGGI